MTQKRKPLIGITTVQDVVQKPIVFASQSYVDMIVACGALPVLVTSDASVAQHLDGLLIIGGQDVDATLYQDKAEVSYEAGKNEYYRRPLDYAPNRGRDDFEIALYQAAKAKKIPILGICRGLQLINIAEGGTLYEELPKSAIFHESGNDGWTQGHFIKIDTSSKAYELMQVEQYYMSSRHHQGIKKLGHRLKACAWAQDGLIEMFEWAGDEQWVFAVQGHIEQTRTNFPLYDRLLGDFIDCAANSDQSSTRFVGSAANAKKAFV